MGSAQSVYKNGEQDQREHHSTANGSKSVTPEERASSSNVTMPRILVPISMGPPSVNIYQPNLPNSNRTIATGIKGNS